MDRTKLYITSLISAAALLLSFLFGGFVANYVTCGLLLVLTPLTLLLVRRRKAPSVRSRDVLILTIALATLFVVLTQFSGLVFEFYKNPYFINRKWLVRNILPALVIIVCSEVLRRVLVTQKSLLVSIAAFIACLAAEVTIFSGLSGINSFNRFMDLLGMTLMPALTGGILCHHVSRRYGALSPILYRVITTLYFYFFPTMSGISDALVSCIKIILPLALLALIKATCESEKKVPNRASRTVAIVSTTILCSMTLAVAALVSCQFRYGVLVIATESMTGELNKGDMALFERYEDQPIEIGQVIIFEKYGNKIVHRVIEFEVVDGQTRYITKGDANPAPDDGFVTKDEIVGLSNAKIPAIGHGALFLHNMLENNRKEAT